MTVSHIRMMFLLGLWQSTKVDAKPNPNMVPLLEKSILLDIWGGNTLFFKKRERERQIQKKLEHCLNLNETWTLQFYF